MENTPHTECPMKRCYICRETKPLEEFYPEKGRKDGRSYCCSSCDKKRTQTARKEKGLYHSEAYRAMQKRKGRYKYEVRRESLLAYYQRNKNHIKARTAVKAALRTGKLEKQPCVECKEPKVHAHHHAGYEPENWLNIIWLCNEHHRIAHHGN